MFTPKAPAGKIDSNSSEGKESLAKLALNRAILGRKPAFGQKQDTPPMKFK